MFLASLFLVIYISYLWVLYVAISMPNWGVDTRSCYWNTHAIVSNMSTLHLRSQPSHRSRLSWVTLLKLAAVRSKASLECHLYVPLTTARDVSYLTCVSSSDWLILASQLLSYNALSIVSLLKQRVLKYIFRKAHRMDHFCRAWFNKRVFVTYIICS